MSPRYHSVQLHWSILFCSFALNALAGVPSSPLYFDDQLVDHLSKDNSGRWKQRYYASDTFFDGPGSPIFLIMGGEGAIEPSTGIYYPFIAHHLAKDFGAYVLQPEHRFYGESQPMGSDFSFSNKENAPVTTALMTTEQAMWDAVNLVQHTRKKLNCLEGQHRCPVITVGGSYPGFLSLAMRIVHPNIVDMSYAASAPIGFYSQEVHQFEYYDHITLVADKASPGCAGDIRSTLLDGLHPLFHNITSSDDVDEVASILGICQKTVPMYITDDVASIGRAFFEELTMVVAYTFANYNMAYYPPNESTSLFRACETFQNQNLKPSEKLAIFLQGIDVDTEMRTNTCFNMTSQLPSGGSATISSGDWSGVGTKKNGEMWDFQTCTLNVEHIGFGPDSMFPLRPWTQEWMFRHCQDRFGVSPDPYKLVQKWNFDDLSSINATRILLTNGLNDGWSVGGIKYNISDTVLALNFENGAHHSDLSGTGPSTEDTQDIKDGLKQIKSILQNWLDVIAESKPTLVQRSIAQKDIAIEINRR